MTRSELTDKLADIYRAKNHDYGNSAHETFVAFGEVSYVVRLSDKLRRLASLWSGERRVKDESILDTLGDAITYLAMLIAEINVQLNGGEGTGEEAFDETIATLSKLGNLKIPARHPQDPISYLNTLTSIYWHTENTSERADRYFILANVMVSVYLNYEKEQ